jgi:hypothetical protein
MATEMWRLIQLAVVAATYGLVQYGPRSGFIGFLARSGYFGCFAILYSTAFTLSLIYSRILWPLWLSPLNKLPHPKVCLPVPSTLCSTYTLIQGGHWLNGHFWEIFWAGTGEVEKRW